MKRFIHEKNPVEILDDMQKDYQSEEEYSSTGWELVRSKAVYDFDGFLTDYTLWHNNETDEWCTVFGDKDLYHPWDSDHDMDFDNEDDAEDWFADYDTDYEDE